MNSSKQKDKISLHGGDDFPVEGRQSPQKKQKCGTLRGPENYAFKSAASRGLDDDIAPLLDGCHDIENNHIFNLDELCNAYIVMRNMEKLSMRRSLES